MMTAMARRKTSCPLRRSTSVEMMTCIHRTKAVEFDPPSSCSVSGSFGGSPMAYLARFRSSEVR